MNLSAFIARRYFLSLKSSNAVNIITGISVLGIMVGTAALIIVLSAFNGLEDLVRGFYRDFDPDLKISSVEGKYFNPQEIVPAMAGFKSDFSATAFSLEEKALVSFEEQEYIATLKGTEAAFTAVNDVEQNIIKGQFEIGSGPGGSEAVLGAGVAYFLRFNEYDLGSDLQIFVPGEAEGLDLNQAYSSRGLRPAGIFSIQPEFDEQYIITDLDFVRDLLERPRAVSSLEIKVKDYSNIDRIQEDLQAALPPGFKILNRDQQQAVFFKVMKSEGLFTFLVFALILGIGTLTVAGSLTMLMFEKRQNLHSLFNMGMTLSRMRRIFYFEGLTISGVGGLSGLVLGVLIVWLQQKFHLLYMGDGYVVEAYPVELRWRDVALVALTVFVLSISVSWLTAQRLNEKLWR